jgi:beta-galactosidase
MQLTAVSAGEPGSFELWINNGWRFRRLDEADEARIASPLDELRDDGWEPVALPHNPHVEKFDEPFPWQGVCWYRKTIQPDSAWAAKRVSVRFGAAMHIADVWVNGVHRLEHLGGYLPFDADVTSEARSGSPIEIAVRLDNRDTDRVPPGKPVRDLDFNYPGGLYRGVKLVVTDCVHITDPMAANTVAGGGVFVTYSDVTKDHATVHVATQVASDTPGIARRCTVHTTLMDTNGNMVADALATPVMISGNGTHTFKQDFRIDRPLLWHPDSPNLYHVRSTVLHDVISVDEITTRIGIRTVEIGSRVVINGEEVHIAGSNRHQSHPYIEYALSPNASRRDAQRIKDGGFNFVRLAHYPQDPAFIDACDDLGLLVQAPIPGWQIFHATPSFVSASFQNIRDLIRRDRNHPSIIIWEPNLNETNGDHTDWCNGAHEIAHQEYPGSGCFTFGDAYPAWTPGWDVKYLTREYGDFGFGGNESTSRHTRGDGEQALLQQAWNFQWCHNAAWRRWADPSISFHGDATWCMFDYNRGYYPKPCTSGMMDIFRLPKYVYYFFQSQRDPTLLRHDCESGPMLFVASDWTQRESPTKVVVFSNCDEVCLYLNGRLVAKQRPDSGPDSRYSHKEADIDATVGGEYDNTGGNPYDGGNGKHLDHPPFTFFNVPFEAGELKAVGHIDGVSDAEHSVRTPENPVAINLTFDIQRTPLAADGADAVFLRAIVVDVNGTTVPVSALPSLSFSVDGPARIVGDKPAHVEAGIASVFVQSTGDAGEIVVTATAVGMRPGTTTIESHACPQIISRSPATPL